MGQPPRPERPPLEARRRVVIDGVTPQLDGGRFSIKRVIGERIDVEADLIADGHDRLAGVVMFRRRADPPAPWQEVPLAPTESGNDRWRGSFDVDALGTWEYTVSGWIDDHASWAWGVGRKLDAGQDVELELAAGAALFDAAAERAMGDGDAAAADGLRRIAARLRAPGEAADRAAGALDQNAQALMRAHPNRDDATVWDPVLPITVDRERAGFSSWYELFPRSAGPAGKHGTFADAAKRMLPYVAEMGFDVVYLPPIHPIGRAHRKGPDNSLRAGPNDPGSPWAIGGPEGGHKAIHPELGTLEDFRAFIRAARDLGLEVAMDIAFQASPDHPYLREHPEWFLRRPDGSIQHAENPPKKYEDIVPFAFTGPGWESLWLELESIFLHWIEVGVRIFRVDNPHTKPIPFWRWCIGRLKARHPDVIFLAEAFTRPKMMNMLAKVGFSQSYTYFTWRNTKAELTEYVTTLSATELAEYFRPNFWPNTPDILPEHLRYGGRPAFIARAVLAATLSPNWGIYGPAFELGEHVGRDGVEEYAQNEKYQLRSWDLGRTDSLRPLLKRLNEIRRENRALQRLDGTTFHEVENDFLLCYSRRSGESTLLVVVNLDPHNPQSGWVRLDLGALGMTDDASFQVHDLLGDARYLWRGPRGFVSLDPRMMPAHVFAIRRRVRTEHNFEYYL